MIETWIPIPEFKNKYEVSNMGSVRSITQKVNQRTKGGVYINITYPGRILALCSNQYGYLMANLLQNTKQVHRLVAEAFIPNPENKPCVNHINGIKTDNRVENLEWVTYSENQKHAYSIGIHSAIGEKNGRAKLNEEIILKIKEHRKAGRTQQYIADMFNISRPHVSSILSGKFWSHV